MKLKEKLSKTEGLRSSQPDVRVTEIFKKNYIVEEKETIEERINRILEKNKYFKKISKKLKINPIYLLIILLIPFLILLLTFFNFTTKLITTIYPLYMSFKTLQYQVNKSKKNGKLYKQEDEDNDTTQWLSYWLLYSFVINSECILGSLVDKIPLYKLLKFIFLLSCFLPQVRLSVVIYIYFTSKLYQLYGENVEESIIGLIRSVSTGKIKTGEDDSKETHEVVKNKKTE